MAFRIDVYFHTEDSVENRLDQALSILQRLETKIGEIMATLDEVLAEISAQTTKLDSVIALIDGLKQQLADLLSGVVVPPAVQAKIDEAFATAKTNAAKIADALDENVPPETPASMRKK